MKIKCKPEVVLERVYEQLLSFSDAQNHSLVLIMMEDMLHT
jgi:hypothetical protein